MRRNLFIASEVRSGSTFVAESIAYYLNQRFGFELWELARESFSALTWESPIDEIVSTARSLYLDRSGFACSKVMCKALSLIHKAAAASPEVNDIFFGRNTYWIVVRRKDKLRQAVSLATAEKTGLYHFYGEPAQASDNDTLVEPAEIEKSLKAILLSDLYLEVFAQSLPEDRTLSLFYEDFRSNNGEHINLINELCQFPIDSEDPTAWDLAKLKPTGQQAKTRSRDIFCDWLLKNYD